MLRKSLFLKINTVTIGSVLVLILVGSIVRSLGAGMGCPDWPKCFGSYVPPTSANELPEDYMEVFRQQRLAKNARLASLFSKIGYGSLSEKILNDPFIQEEQPFNVTKAWIEYINRLVGVVIGLLVFGNLVFSFSYSDIKAVPIGGVAAFILTGFQGWVGSIVVSTNLLKGMITFHLLMAFVILALLIWMGAKARSLSKVADTKLMLIVLVVFIVLIPQIIMGTEVRALIDPLLAAGTERSGWVNALTSIFLVHRSYSWLIFVGSLAILLKVRPYKHLWLPSLGLVVQVVLIILAGILMVEGDFLFWVQPLHLILATGIFSTLFYLILRLKPA